MNPTRALGAILFVVGIGWFLAMPAILPAAYHGHVHTGHEHAQYAATPVDPDGQFTATLVAASANAAEAAPARNWTAVRVAALTPDEQEVFDAARSGTANATDPARRTRYRDLEKTHPFVAVDDAWYELDLEDAENYTRLVAAPVETRFVTDSVAVEPASLPGEAGTQARTLAESDGAVLLSSPQLPTPLYVSHGDRVHLVERVGPAPEPPSLPALVLFLVPGVVLAVLGAFLGVRG